MKFVTDDKGRRKYDYYYYCRGRKMDELVVWNLDAGPSRVTAAREMTKYEGGGGGVPFCYYTSLYR